MPPRKIELPDDVPPGRPALVVGIGASAGGLEPLCALLGGLPAGRGLAVVVVQNRQPLADGSVVSAISAATTLTVEAAAHDTVVLPDHVYVVPIQALLSIVGGRLVVQDVALCQGLPMPVDHFFCTLAADQGHRAVGVVLSGDGLDGAHGLAEIKAAGGATAVQHPETAAFPGMPRSAIEAGNVDAALPADELAALLVARADELAAWSAEQLEQAGLEAVVAAVRHATGHDFRCYKRATLVRRVRRRMAVHHLETYDAYARLLRTLRDEPAAMRKDLLIGVTEFFRQGEAWRVLEARAIQRLVAAAPPQSTLRAWVPACSSGKEAYSLAILLAEAIEQSGKKLSLQIFATDADASAIDVARAGRYAEDELKGVSPARLRRFFAPRNGRYEVVKQLRQLIVFAPQDLLSDPPFSRLDLVSCRNLLIYLDASVQKRVIQLFHFALCDGGFLFLGAAENINGYENLFEPVSSKWRLYGKLGGSAPKGLDLPLLPVTRPAVAIPPVTARPRATLATLTEHALAERFGPAAAVVVDRKGTLLYLHGKVQDFLQHVAGEHTSLLADAAREGLRNRLASAVLQAGIENKRIVVQARVGTVGKSLPVKVTVSPLRQPREVDGLLLVTFEPQPVNRTARTPLEGERPGFEVSHIEAELRLTRDELSSTIEQLEQSNEHLKASNEEAMSTNEELQSANEELETSKEELHSLNEELNAVNQRLQEKVDELEKATESLRASAAEARWLGRFPGENPNPVVRIAADGRVLYRNPATAANPGFGCEVGEPLPQDELRRLVQVALSGGTQQFREVDLSGTPYAVVAVPIPSEGYANLYGRDITERRAAEVALRASETKYRNLFENMAEEVHFWRVVRDAEGRIATWRLVDANPPTLRTWGRASIDEIRGKTTDEIFGPGATEHFLPVVQKIMTEGTPHSFEDYFPNLDKHFRFTSVPLGEHFITTGADITAIKKAEEQIRSSLREKETLLKEVHHRVKNNLQVISSLVSLQASTLAEPGLRNVFDDVRDRVRSMALVHEKLYQSENLAGVDLAEYARSLLHQLWRGHNAPGVALKLALEPVSLTMEAAVPCGLILNELASNALRHAFRGRKGGEVNVTLTRGAATGRARLSVRDDGVGLPPGLDWRKATSLGLRLVQLLATQIGGTVSAEPVQPSGLAFTLEFGDTVADRGA